MHSACMEYVSAMKEELAIIIRWLDTDNDIHEDLLHVPDNHFCNFDYCTERSAVKPAVQLLQIQEVHLVPHSNTCNFFAVILITFSYLSYVGHLSLLGLQTKTR